MSYGVPCVQTNILSIFNITDTQGYMEPLPTTILTNGLTIICMSCGQEHTHNII